MRQSIHRTIHRTIHQTLLSPFALARALRWPLVAALLLCLQLAACSQQAKEQVLKISGPTMGTQYHISWVGTDPETAEPLQVRIDERLREINRSMSTYDPESELSRLNLGQLAVDADGWVSLSADLTQVMSDALLVWRASGGAFDVTVGPLVNLWGFGPEARPEHTPDEAEIAARRAHIGSEKIELDAMHHRLRLQGPLYIDLSAIAKGWAVDELARLLTQQGIQSYMVEVGGELRTRGSKPDNSAWRIAIERPLNPDTAEAAFILEPGNRGMATSGDYRNYFEEGGVRYSHTIDPATGHPIKHALASVSVVHSSTGLADAWATAITVAGPEKGMAIARQHQLAVLMLVREGDGFVQRASPAFIALFPQAADAQ